MSTTSRHPSAFADVRASLKKHATLLIILGGLTVIAAGANVLTGNVFQGFPKGSDIVIHGSGSIACTSSGTIFDVRIDEKMDIPSEVVQKYHRMMSAAFAEHERALATPSAWTCSANTFERMAPRSQTLSAMASTMPQWKKRLQDVTFVKFPDVVADFQRLYECKLSEFDASWSTTVVAQGYDRYDSSAQKGKPITQFTETPRIVEFQNSLHEEVELTRLALQRSLLTLRSLELGAPINVELNCLEREMLDMRNELSLLADASACFPRIWDAATSLHEPSNRDPAPDAGSSSSISTPEPQSPYPYPSSDSYAP
jgi:hypothetical protein